MLDRRDWTTYIYVPLLVPIVFLLPYFTLKYYERSVRLTNLTVSFAQGSPDLAKLSSMLEEGPVKQWSGVDAETGDDYVLPEIPGFEVLQDSRIVDLRAWDPASTGIESPDSRFYSYRRMVVTKLPGNKDDNLFVMRLMATSPRTQMRFPPQQLEGKARKIEVVAGKEYKWAAVFDFEKVPAGSPVEIYAEYQSPGLLLRGNEHSNSVRFDVLRETAELTQWFLMPRGKKFKDYRYIEYQIGKPATAIEAKILTKYLSKDGLIVAYKTLSADPGYTHEISWTYN